MRASFVITVTVYFYLSENAISITNKTILLELVRRLFGKMRHCMAIWTILSC
jgi:hypothetical protein